MHIFVYEHVTAGGMEGDGAASGSLLAEGAAMVQQVAGDLLRIDGLQVTVLAAAGLPQLWPPRCVVHRVEGRGQRERQLVRLARQCDATLLIAPEHNGDLESCCRRVEDAGGRLLSPSAEFISLAADKHRTATRLADHGVPVPPGVLLAAGQPLPAGFPYPAVLKPNTGAGSHGVRRIAAPVAVPASPGTPWRLEPFCAGLAASVSLLCGPAETVVLPPSQQLLSDDGRFRYLGGRGPLAPPLHRRAARLAQRTAAALPPVTGYLGIDLVLGADEDGRADFVIEINPRLTTSYGLLRQQTRGNLAQAMLDVAAGRSCNLAFSDEHVEFWL